MKAIDVVRLLTQAKSVLVVDDDQYIRMIFKAMEDAFECEMTFAPTSAEATEFLKKSRFDYVFLDIKLGPTDSGMDVLRIINTLQLKCHVTIMSGSVNLHDLMQEANNLGVISFLIKSVSFSTSYLAQILDRLGMRRKNPPLLEEHREEMASSI